MSTVLVTGATGQLGTPTTAALRAAGHDVRALSRRPGPDLVSADLLTGAGLAAALQGVDVVVHLATTKGSADVPMAERLVAAARQAGVAHLALISIVGIEKIPLRFYQDKVQVERIVRESGVPFTIQRATQFHSLVAGLFSAQRFLPVLVVPSVRFQPIAVEDVAGRLAELASGGPQETVPDIGGPQERTARDLARAWRSAVHSRRPMVPLRLPLPIFAALDAGANLVPGPPFGQRTFEEYLARR